MLQWVFTHIAEVCYSGYLPTVTYFRNLRLKNICSALVSHGAGTRSKEKLPEGRTVPHKTNTLRKTRVEGHGKIGVGIPSGLKLS